MPRNFAESLEAVTSQRQSQNENWSKQYLYLATRPVIMFGHLYLIQKKKESSKVMLLATFLYICHGMLINQMVGLKTIASPFAWVMNLITMYPVAQGIALHVRSLRKQSFHSGVLLKAHILVCLYFLHINIQTRVLIPDLAYTLNGDSMKTEFTGAQSSIW